MIAGLPLLARGTAGAPLAPFVHLTALWIQVTGTWCNLQCTHCLNASGPREPWLRPLDAATVRRAVADAEGQGVKVDTRLRGNGNGGHVYGQELPREQREQLLEYLKTL